MTSRANRAAPRIHVNEMALVYLTSGNRRCKGLLTDFTPTSCGVRIISDEINGWLVRDLGAFFTIDIHGEQRQGKMVRLSRTKSESAGTGSACGDCWDLAVKLS